MSDPFGLSSMNLAYDRLRANESMFPVPGPAATVNVGTFDAATGRFAFSTAIKSETTNVNTPPSGETGGKPELETEYYLAVNAVRVSLQFRVAHPQGPVSADVNGVTL